MKKTLRNDIILIICLLLIAVLGIIYLFNFRKTGDRVKVTVDGEIFGIYSLNQDLTLDIHSDKDKMNRLIIKEGKVYMESATCPDGICVKHKPVFRDGESIICLPNGVVVTIISDDENSPDIVI